MEEKGFVTIKKYKIGGEGIRHLEHVLRIKTQRKLSGEIKVYGDSYEDLKVSYAKSRKVSNLYLEVMVSGANEKTLEILDLLRERFKGHKIMAVEHYDESKPHCHFLISWCHPETGKSIRLSAEDLGVNGSIVKSIMEITGQKFTNKGQGRKRIPLREYLADPDLAQKRIEMMKERDAKALGFIEKMIKLYGPITLTVISNKGRMDLQTVKSVDEVNLKKLRAFESKGEGIYFYPAFPEKVKALFLDDVPFSRLKDLPRETIIVQTSHYKFQAHIPYQYGIEHQKIAVRIYDADRGASAIQQPRRLAYFVNQKYPDKPEVREIEIEGRTSTVKDLYHQVLEYSSRLKQIIPIREKYERFNAQRKIRNWQDFYDGDESVADARYAYHLMLNGFSDEEIKEKLRYESRFLEIRKKGHVEDYLDRTVRKVREFFYQNLNNRLGGLERDLT